MFAINHRLGADEVESTQIDYMYNTVHPNFFLCSAKTWGRNLLAFVIARFANITFTLGTLIKMFATVITVEIAPFRIIFLYIHQNKL